MKNLHCKTIFKINIFLAIAALYVYINIMCIDSTKAEAPIGTAKKYEIEQNADFYLKQSHEKPVILKFYADWCTPCKHLTPIFEEIAKEHIDQHMYASINIEENEELADFFNIRSIPTIIILKDGAEADRIIGLVGKPELIGKIIEHSNNAIIKKNETTQIEKLAIIGSGPAGLTAALYAARAGLEPIVFEGHKPGGQLMDTALIENWPGYPAISGTQLIETLKNHALLAGARFIQQEITSVNFTSSPLILTTEDGTMIKAQSTIIATGATAKRLYCPGEDIFWGNGISTCTLCDGALYKNKRVVIVGGGNTAIENALFLKRFTDKITIIQIHDTLKVSQATMEKIINDASINIIYNSTVTKFIGTDNKLTQIEISDIKTKQRIYLDVDGIFLAIGLSPNTDLFCDQLECLPSGHIKVHENVKTSVLGVFVAGDAQDMLYRQAIVSAGFGSMAAIEAEKYLQQLT